MGNITWTKSWSSADDGIILGGADLQNIQSDITAIVNGNITDSNIKSSAAIQESKVLFNASTGHNHDGVTSRVVSISALRTGISGGIMSWLTTTTLKACAGVIEIDGVLYSRTADSSTLDLTADTDYLGGVNQRGKDKLLYIYAYNDTAASWNIKLYGSAPTNSNCGTSTSGPLIFLSASSVWYRCIGAIYLNNTGSGEIEEFYQRGNRMLYVNAYANNDLRVLNAGNQVAFTAIDCSRVMPAISTLADLNTQGGGAESLNLRPTGATTSTGIYYYFTSGNEGKLITAPTNSAQSLDYFVNANSVSMWFAGYTMDIR